MYALFLLISALSVQVRADGGTPVAVPVANQATSMSAMLSTINTTTSSVAQNSALSTNVILPGPAPVVQDSANNPSMICNFAPMGLSQITGAIGFSAAANGSFQVLANLDNLPLVGGPFMYHIHEHPVPLDGNCNAAGGHLNPYHGSISATDLPNKEVGDLSGKHGMINGPSFETSYTDPFLSLNPKNPAYVGGLLIVIHFLNNTRLACANITLLDSTNEAAANVTVVNGTADKNTTIYPPNYTVPGNQPGNLPDTTSNVSINATAAAGVVSPLSMAAIAALAILVI